MQRCCPLLSTCLGVSEETVVAGQQGELRYRERRSSAELSAWDSRETRPAPPKTRSLHRDLQTSRSTHHRHIPSFSAQSPADMLHSHLLSLVLLLLRP